MHVSPFQCDSPSLRQSTHARASWGACAGAAGRGGLPTQPPYTSAWHRLHTHTIPFNPRSTEGGLTILDDKIPGLAEPEMTNADDTIDLIYRGNEKRKVRRGGGGHLGCLNAFKRFDGWFDNSAGRFYGTGGAVWHSPPCVRRRRDDTISLIYRGNEKSKACNRWEGCLAALCSRARDAANVYTTCCARLGLHTADGAAATPPILEHCAHAAHAPHAPSPTLPSPTRRPARTRTSTARAPTSSAA